MKEAGFRNRRDVTQTDFLSKTQRLRAESTGESMTLLGR